ncbi:hypothetical protein X777_09014 [Ooceraea biroi]|uniref:Uncharacterized protein n=1 Tax=Ooceraea biroi TaxID=2015173 RepID=A0A026WBC7_OOCBI|nr:hypothetical protein X777_09014 [Ooceraea biroi]
MGAKLCQCKVTGKLIDELSTDETYTDLTKRRIDYPPKDGWSSQNFPLAIEGPRELWRTLAGYSRDGSDE